MENELARKDKELKLLHEQYIVKESKIWEVNQKIEIKNRNPEKIKVFHLIQITEETLKELQDQLVKIRAEREVVEA